MNGRSVHRRRRRVADGVAGDADAGARRQRVLRPGESLAGGKSDFAIGANHQAAGAGVLAVDAGKQIEFPGVVYQPLEYGGVAAVPALQVQALRSRGRVGCGAQRRQAYGAVYRRFASDALVTGEVVAAGEIRFECQTGVCVSIS